MKDLFILCPDASWEAVVSELVQREDRLGVAQIDADVRRVAGRTAGWVRAYGVAFLRAVRPSYSHAALLFDHEGCGDTRGPSEIEADLDAALAPDWEDRAMALAVDPEMEEWVLGTAPWLNNLPALQGMDVRRWFDLAGWWPLGAPKPPDPKGAIRALFAAHGIPFSAATFRRIARGASLQPARCRSRSYHRLVAGLRRWFPPTL